MPSPATARAARQPSTSWEPKTVRPDQLASEAMALMRPYRIDELPVVDDHDRPVGLIDIQDLVILKMLDVEPET